MPYQLSEINEKIRRDPAAFLAECDAHYQERIHAAVDKILARMKESPIVLLSGPSGSGKTTTAMKVERELERRGVNAHTVSMDNYFKTLNRRTAPRTPEGDIDYESPKLLDMELLDETFDRLSRGEGVIVPHFEFARQMRNDSRGTPLRLGKDEIAIFEGIHALNDDIAGRHPEATGMYISARSNILEGEQLRFKGTWMRISRRAVRDYNFRGTDLLETLLMWYNVRRGEKKYISPYKGRAHVIIDSSLRYEVPVFAHYADALRAAVEQVPPDNERWQEYHDLVDAFRPGGPRLPAAGVHRRGELPLLTGGAAHRPPSVPYQKATRRGAPACAPVRRPRALRIVWAARRGRAAIYRGRVPVRRPYVPPKTLLIT